MRTSVRALYERRLADQRELFEGQLKEKDRLVDALAEQIDYLRAQLAMTKSAPPSGQTIPWPSDLPDIPIGSEVHMSEEEEEIRSLHTLGHLSEVDARAHLAGLGLTDLQL